MKLLSRRKLLLYPEKTKTDHYKKNYKFVQILFFLQA